MRGQLPVALLGIRDPLAVRRPVRVRCCPPSLAHGAAPTPGVRRRCPLAPSMRGKRQVPRETMRRIVRRVPVDARAVPSLAQHVDARKWAGDATAPPVRPQTVGQVRDALAIRFLVPTTWSS